MRRRGRVLAAVLVALGLGVVGLAFQHATVLADWYAGFAARHLPAGASSFAPANTSTGAFFFCARQVARRMEGEFSVETFPSEKDTRFTELGDGYYRVESWVEEAREDGRQFRIDFTCTARYARGRWTLEELKLANLAER